MLEKAIQIASEAHIGQVDKAGQPYILHLIRVMNAGQTESVIAGFFNTKLLGDAYYFGKLVKKRSIGDGNEHVSADDIVILNNITYLSYMVLLIINLIIGGIACFIL